jgi:hypothetical protein
MAHAILVLAMEGSAIASIVRLGDEKLVATFGFPQIYPET